MRKEEILGILQNKGAKIHFIGAGGIGMYSLCMLTRRLGYLVSGTDREDSELCAELRRAGCVIGIGHSAAAVTGAELVVYTLAIEEDNPEILYAEGEGIPTVSRAEYLGALMTVYKERIGVSGTHGKSTTVAMLHSIFERAGKEPTTILGARARGGSPLTVGKRDYLIYESCEYKDSFLRFSPTVALFTNLEYDHVDYFKSFEALSDSFFLAMSGAPIAIVNADDDALRSLLSKRKGRRVTFGERAGADIRADINLRECGRYSLEIFHTGGHFVVDLAIPGRHNAKNALAAASVALTYGIPYTEIKAALEAFSGIERRLEVIGERDRAKIYYDYAHHPTEIECTIKTVREMTDGKICVVFKPHTYSRTARFITEFARALSLADEVILCDVSGIREEAIKGVSSERIARLIGSHAICLSDSAVAAKIDEVGADAVIIMGAASLDEVKRDIIGK